MAFNISVEKKKNNVIIPIIIVVIIVLIGTVGLIVTGGKKDNSKDAGNDQVINIYEDEQARLAKEEERKRQEEEKAKKAKIDAVYERFKDASWASKTDNEKVKLFVIKDKKIFYENGNISEEISFDKGTPKYIRTVIYGGGLSCFTIVTEEGEAYLINISNNSHPEVWLASGEIDTSKVRFEKLNISSKVIDVAINMPGYTVKNTYPYYLTEDAKVINKDLKTFDEINRNHIISLSDTINDVFVNKDGTIEVLRNYENLEYMDVKTSKNEVIKVIYIFKISNDYYAIDENHKLYTFASSNLYVASMYPKFAEKNINSVVYNKDDQTVTVKSEDGGTEVFEKIIQYFEVKAEK